MRKIIVDKVASRLVGDIHEPFRATWLFTPEYRDFIYGRFTRDIAWDLLRF
jgi:hypothetical protein